MGHDHGPEPPKEKKAHISRAIERLGVYLWNNYIVKWEIGLLPRTYNFKVHGPYVPYRYYGQRTFALPLDWGKSQSNARLECRHVQAVVRTSRRVKEVRAVRSFVVLKPRKSPQMFHPIRAIARPKSRRRHHAMSARPTSPFAGRKGRSADWQG